MSQPDTSEAFYVMAKQSDVAVTYTLLMDSESSRWFALNVYATKDQHMFVHLSLSKGELSFRNIRYTLWHLKSEQGHRARRVGVDMVEYKPSDTDFDRCRVSNH